MNTLSSAAVARVCEIAPLDLKSGLERGEIALVDVREPVEHAGERIAGATLMPLGQFNPQRAREIAGSRVLVLHCKGGSRSGKAAQAMLNAEADSITHLAGGIDAWKAAGLPIERDANVPISIMRQVQITAGSLVLLGVVLGLFVSPWCYGLSAFIGAGLMVAGITDTCGMAMMLSKMPWNRGQ